MSATGSEDYPEEKTDSCEGVKTYDLVVVGTGLVESILACAASLAGKKVLHMDGLPYYGRNDATLTLDEVVEEGGKANAVSSSPSSSSSSSSAPPPPLESSGIDDDDSGSGLGSSGSSSSCESKSYTSIPMREVTDLASIRTVLSASDYTHDPHDVPMKWRARDHHPTFRGYLIEKDGNKDKVQSSECCHPSFWGYESSREMSLKRALLDGRRYAIDSSCRLVGGAGKMVDALIKSGTGQHMEFKPIDQLFYAAATASASSAPSLQPVPCSKSEIFSSKSFSALEKRHLMKFMQSAMDWGRLDESGTLPETLNEKELAKGRSLHRPQNKEQKDANFGADEFLDKPVAVFFEHIRLPKNLQNTIVEALCLNPFHIHSELDCISTKDALRALYRHLAALGRFGTTAFIYPDYGSAEICQSFCRMCAVWGGTYKLQCAARSIKIDPSTSKVVSVIDSEGEETKTSAFICAIDDWENKPLSEKFLLSRICVCHGQPFADKPRCLSVLAPGVCGNPSAVHIVQVESSVCVCPDGMSIVYMSTTIGTTVTDVDAIGILDSSLELLRKSHDFKEIYFQITKRPLYSTSSITELDIPVNMAIANGSKQEVYHYEALESAHCIFSKLFPGADFLARPYIHGDDNDDEDDDIVSAALATAMASSGIDGSKNEE